MTGAALDFVALPDTSTFAREGWSLLVSTMDGLWLVSPGDGRTRHLHGRPARALVGDAHVWAVFDDELRLLTSAGLNDLAVHFELPLSAQPAAQGILVGTRNHTWRLTNRHSVRLADVAAEDLLCIPNGFIAALPGSVASWSDSDEAWATSPHAGGSPVSLVMSSDPATFVLVAAPWVLEFEVATLEPQRRWSVGFGPLAAAEVLGRVFICGGESGLYLADKAVTHVDSVTIPAALDLATRDGSLFVATGAGVLRLDVADDLRVTHRIELPGVSRIAASENLVIALVEGFLELLSPDDLSRRGRLRTRVDPRSIRISGHTVAVRGYDAIEVVQL